MARIIPSPFREQTKLTKDMIRDHFKNMMHIIIEPDDPNMAFVLSSTHIVLSPLNMTAPCEEMVVEVENLPTYNISTTSPTLTAGNTYYSSMNQARVRIRPHHHYLQSDAPRISKNESTFKRDYYIDKFLELISTYNPDISALQLRQLENKVFSYESRHLKIGSVELLVEELIIINIDYLYNYLIKKI
jgi:hypothetical protein